MSDVITDWQEVQPFVGLDIICKVTDFILLLPYFYTGNLEQVGVAVILLDWALPGYIKLYYII